MRIYFSFFLLISYILLPLNFAITVKSYCNYPKTNYTIGATFQSNLERLLTDLPKNAVQNNYFYNTAYGKPPDQVYGLTMCYADARLSECNSCLFQAPTDITNCTLGLRNEEFALFDGCMIRYSDVAFNASNNVGGIYRVPRSAYDSENLTDPEKFSKTFHHLIDSLATNASETPLKLVAGTTNYTTNGRIYALVQCRRQLPADECKICIGYLTNVGVEDLICNSSVYRDQKIVAPSCYLRYALDPFYVISEAHAPRPSTGMQSREPILTGIFAIVIGALLVLVADVPFI